MMEIKRGIKSFYIGESEDTAQAEMTFVPTGERLLIIDHTYVSDELSGKGVGRMLLDELIGWARKENKKIIPLCPFAKAQMEKYPEYHDMLA